MRAVVALIGRPNVGKSTLFNRMIVKDRTSAKTPAITEETPGVTRDRNYGDVQWQEKQFIAVDTGGLFDHAGQHDGIGDQVKEQALFAIQEADLIVHLCDGKEGLNHSDLDIANLLRESGKRVIRVINKIDSPQKEEAALEFYRLGSEEVMPVSARTGHCFEEFMDSIIAQLPPAEPVAEEIVSAGHIPHIAVVGRPNSGKSTLINSLLSKKRLIVSPLPGTTRDAIDSLCTYYGRKYLFIDTAGIKRKATSSSIEEFSIVRALKSIERSDIVIIVIDVQEALVEQDQRLAGIVEEAGKSVILMLNKWDTVTDPESDYKKLMSEVRQKLWLIPYAPCITASGLNKKRITTIFPLIDDIMNERRKRVPTAEINRLLSRISALSPFPSCKGRSLKCYYMTQTGIEPPEFAIFVNYPEAFTDQHARYFEKALRHKYSFRGTPLRIHFKPR